MNQQAVMLLQEIYDLVRNDARAITHQSIGQYRSALLREITERIKTAVSAEAATAAQVQARAADEGLIIEIVCADASGEIRKLKPLTIEQARRFILEIELSISDVITREFTSPSTVPTPRMQ